MISNFRRKKGKGLSPLVICIAVFLLSFFVGLAIELAKSETKNKVSSENAVPYPTFLAALEEEKVSRVIYVQDADKLTFFLEGDTAYTTDNPGTEDFKEKLLLHGAAVETDLRLTRLNNLLDRLPVVLYGAMLAACMAWMFCFALRFVGKKQKKDEKAKKVLLDQVVGLDEIKSELTFLVSLIKEQKNPRSFRAPKGILLEGPPGNGKTMLAQAIATDADIHFVAVNASDLPDKYVGETGKALRDVFDEALKNAPCLLFIDEIDALGARRSEDTTDSVGREYNAVINTFLTLLDGITDSSGLLVVAATNRASSLDPALIRPGRFDKRFLVPNPDREARMALLKNYLSTDGLDYQKLSSITKGFSAAEIENAANEAKLTAYKEQRDYVTEKDVTDAIRRMRLNGVEKKKVELTARDRKTAAIHEAGHAITGYCFAREKIREIAVCPMTSGAGGYTLTEPAENDEMTYLNDIFGKIVMLMGGRAAEALAFGGTGAISIGSTHDIDEATKIASFYAKALEGFDYGCFDGEGSKKLMERAKEITENAFTKATETLKARKTELEKLTAALESSGTVSEDCFETLLTDKRKNTVNV